LLNKSALAGARLFHSVAALVIMPAFNDTVNPWNNVDLVVFSPFHSVAALVTIAAFNDTE
jgi:hypothetical protein